MGKLFIDITELIGWQGKLTGVPRVMNELSVRFLAEGKAEFLVWDTTTHAYLPANFTRVPAEVTPELQSITEGTLTRALKKAKKHSKVLRKSYEVTQKAYRAIRPSRIAADSILPEIKFANGDTLFVLADWHGSDAAFVDELVNLRKSGIKLVQVCYDLLPIVTPQYSGHATASLTNYVQKVYPLCELIFAISEHTKKDATAFLSSQKLRVPPIEVFRLGDDFEIASPKKPDDSRLEMSKKFLLCVGTIEARKNHTLLYYTYKLAIQRGLDLPDIVIVGRRGWKTDDIYEIITNDPETKDKFIFLHGTSDEELSWLYGHSLFSIYPSFYEGWGLPIAESIAHGTVCIASNTSSMPEVAGTLISYFSPTSTEECLAAISHLLDETHLKAAEKSIRSYVPATWDSAYDKVHLIMRKI